MLDENENRLCLPSGEIVQRAKNLNVVFEVAEMSELSPGAVTRLGVIHYDDKWHNNMFGTGGACALILEKWLKAKEDGFGGSGSLGGSNGMGWTSSSLMRQRKDADQQGEQGGISYSTGI